MRSYISTIAVPAAAMALAKGAMFAVLLAFAPGAALAVDLPDKGTTPYVTHFVFRPLQSIDVPGLGTATLLEAVGTTENMKGEKMLDKMSARCTALSVDSGPKKYIDGACVLADTDGDMIFSTVPCYLSGVSDSSAASHSRMARSRAISGASGIDTGVGTWSCSLAPQ